MKPFTHTVGTTDEFEQITPGRTQLRIAHLIAHGEGVQLKGAGLTAALLPDGVLVTLVNIDLAECLVSVPEGQYLYVVGS